MVSKLFSAAAILAVATLAATATPAHAATPADVPFSFQVNGVTWAGGAYTIERNYLHNLVTLSSRDGKHQATWALMPGNPGPADNNIKLEFDHASATAVLHSVQFGSLVTATLDKKWQSSMRSGL